MRLKALSPQQAVVNALFIGAGLMTLMPIVALLIYAQNTFSSDIWQHIKEYLLLEVLQNTAYLMLGVGVTTLIIGISLAYCIANFDFLGRRYWNWALLLPVAFPGFVLGFVYIGLLDYSGPVQSFARNQGWGWAQSDFLQIRSLWGACLSLGMSLFPYIYLLARNAFMQQGLRAQEGAASLGLNRWQAFYRINLPLARPAIIAGLILVWMETLADFGTVSLFTLPTFTTTLYKAWFSFFSIETAAQLAVLMLSFLAILWFAWLWAAQKQATYSMGHTQKQQRKRLTGWKSFALAAYCGLILSIAAIIPAGQLLIWVISAWQESFNAQFGEYVWHSALLGGLSALYICSISLFLVMQTRWHPSPWRKGWLRLASLGYAIPGAVLAVGIFVPFTHVSDYFGSQFGWVWSGTGLLALILGMGIRLLNVGLQPIESAADKIPPQQQDAAAMLGLNRRRSFFKVILPQLRLGLITAAVLASIDTMKEMPLTLMLRPSGWDTLTTRIFEFTSEGQWELAALPALTIVLLGALPVLLLNGGSKNSKF